MRYVTEKFASGAISSEVLAAAYDQAEFRAATAKNHELFRWMCENLSADALAEPLTHENVTLLIALQKKLAVAPTGALLRLVKACGDDNALRGLLYESLGAKIGADALSIDLLNRLKPYAGQLIGHPEVLLRAIPAAREEPDKLDVYAPFGFNREGQAKATTADVLACAYATPMAVNPKPQKVALVAAIAQHAQAPTDLRAFLSVAARANWDGQKSTQELATVGQGLDATTLRDVVYQSLVTPLGPASTLNAWLKALEVPVEDGWARITRGGEIDLGVGAGGSQTIEEPCTVSRATGGAVILTFVIHRHPGAKATIQNPYGSGKNLKPDRHSTTERRPFNASLGKAIHAALLA